MSFTNYQDDEDFDWSPISISGVAAFSFFALITLYFSLSGERWVPLLDSANLVFHEAGHPIFGVLSERLMVYGGTLGQLAFPLVALVAFWRKRETISFAFAGLWLLQNFFNIARYLGDARTQELPLVGGGEHDWTEILSRWHWLQADTKIASAISFVSGVAIVALWVWLLMRWLRDNYR
jgi:hypothetical protein